MSKFYWNTFVACLHEKHDVGICPSIFE